MTMWRWCCATWIRFQKRTGRLWSPLRSNTTSRSTSSPRGPDTVHRLWPESGPERLHYRLPESDLEMVFHPMDFTQVNADINQRMIKQAMDWLAPEPESRVLDLFCGLGNFSPAACPSCTGSGWC